MAMFTLVTSATLGVAVASLLLMASRSHWRQRRLVGEFRRVYGAEGKDLLAVYTDSPHWQDHIERQWLSRWADRAVVLNRTRPWQGKQLEARVWHGLAGIVEHTPVAIVIPVSGPVTVVRFFRAFLDLKHGKGERLHAAEKELEVALAGSADHAA